MLPFARSETGVGPLSGLMSPAKILEDWMRKTWVLGFALLAIAAFAGAQEIKVTDTNLGNWAYQPQDVCGGVYTGSIDFEVGPGTPPIPIGSLEMRTGTNGNSSPRFWLDGWAGTRLDALTELTYSAYTEQSFDGRQAPYLRLYLDFDGNGSADNNIQFEPAYQIYLAPPGQALVEDTWQTWDALNGGWYANGGAFCSATPGAGVKTLAQILVCQPNATIVDPVAPVRGIGVLTGCGGVAWPNYIGNVDNFRIATAGRSEIYNFDVGVANVTGTKTVSLTRVYLGDTVTWTIILTNEGDGIQNDNAGDEFVDVFPAEVDVVTAGASSGTATVIGNTVTWNGSIAAGESVTITVETVAVAPGFDVFNQGTINYDSNADDVNDATNLTESPGGGATLLQILFPAEIPTASQLGLMLLSLALAGSAFIALRR